MPTQTLRIVQLIDSLEPGGAERMAVNYANALTDKIAFSGLIATRKEGGLKNEVKSKVEYQFLRRKKTLDLKALFAFRKYLRKHKVNIIHAHSSSYFFATLVKVIYPRVKIIWHDHFGNRVFGNSDNLRLKFFSYFFKTIFTVNKDLQTWALNNLLCKDVHFIPNFAIECKNELKLTELHGVNGKRMVCLANLKHPKNHLLLLEAFLESEIYKEEWSLHLVGKDFKDNYSNNLYKFIKENNLESSVFIYGSCNDVSNILKQSNIGILTSTYEGFPVSLLEYGIAKLAVISTDVGYCKEIIVTGETGLSFSIIEKNLTEKILQLTGSKELMNTFGDNLNKIVNQKFSQKTIIKTVIKKYIS